MREVGEVHVDLHRVIQRTAGGLRHGLQVLEYAPGLGFDLAADQLPGGRIERDLARQEHQVARLDRLRIGTDGGGRRRRAGWLACSFFVVPA